MSYDSKLIISTGKSHRLWKFTFNLYYLDKLVNIDNTYKVDQPKPNSKMMNCRYDSCETQEKLS